MINITNIARMLLVSALVMAASGEASAQTGAPKDYAEAMKYRKSADQGDAAAQYELGTMYENGHGVPKDYAEAMKWYRKAADQGNAGAQYKLGHMYHNGYGVPKDYAEAMKWYRKSVDQGNAGAQYGLGYMYENGHGVPKDYAEAMKWFRKAADQGNADAQENLTRLSEERYTAALQKAEDAYRRTPEGKQQCQANCDSARSSCKSNQIWNDTFGRASGLYMPFKNCEGEHENCVASCNNPE